MGYDKSGYQSTLELIMDPVTRQDPTVITIYYLGCLKVFHETTELTVGQTVVFEVKGEFTAWVTLPEGVLSENGVQPPAIGPQAFEVTSAPRAFTVTDKPIMMDYFVSAKMPDGRVEGVHRPPMIIIKKVTA